MIEVGFGWDRIGFMTRYLTPILFFAAAAYVDWHNTSQSGSVLMFPFIDLVYPAAKGDPVQLGKISVWMLVGIGALILTFRLTEEWRYRRQLRANLVHPKDR